MVYTKLCVCIESIWVQAACLLGGWVGPNFVFVGRGMGGALPVCF